MESYLSQRKVFIDERGTQGKREVNLGCPQGSCIRTDDTLEPNIQRFALSPVPKKNIYNCFHRWVNWSCPCVFSRKCRVEVYNHKRYYFSTGPKRSTLTTYKLILTKLKFSTSKPKWMTIKRSLSTRPLTIKLERKVSIFCRPNTIPRYCVGP